MAKPGAGSTKTSLSGTRRSQNSWKSTVITFFFFFFFFSTFLVKDSHFAPITPINGRDTCIFVHNVSMCIYCAYTLSIYIYRERERERERKRERNHSF